MCRSRIATCKSEELATDDADNTDKRKVDRHICLIRVIGGKIIT